MLASNRFDAVQLPNGAYMSHRRFVPWVCDDIVLHHPNGTILVNESIDLVCFNGGFVQGHTLHEPFRSFIYEKIFETDPQYDELVARSALRHEDGCGIEGSWTGFYLLLQDPKYRR
jgi:hypothetical protein